MRSSKQRSRSKSNRQRSLGNIVNRVFDSSGPDGKVRGTPQQIIDKYLLLARDAQLSNDRVAAENFLQHAEHYTRMLSEAQADADARRQSQEQQQRENAPRDGGQKDGQKDNHRDGQRDGGPKGGPRDGSQRDANQRDRQQPSGQDRRDRDDRASSPEAASEILGDPTGGDSDSMLVDTPEARSSDTPSPQPAHDARADENGASDAAAPETSDSAAPKPRNTRKPRGSTGGRKGATSEGEGDKGDGQDGGQGQGQGGDMAGDAAQGDSSSAPAPRKRAVRKPRNAPRKAEGSDGDDNTAAPKSAAE